MILALCQFLWAGEEGGVSVHRDVGQGLRPREFVHVDVCGTI
jgi:hypothetical protein